MYMHVHVYMYMYMYMYIVVWMELCMSKSLYRIYGCMQIYQNTTTIHVQLTNLTRKKEWSTGCWVSCSDLIQRDHNHSEAVLWIRVFNRVQQGSVLYWHCLILPTGGVGDGDIVSQDGYPLQSERRSPRDEDSGGVNGGHSEVMDSTQRTCGGLQMCHSNCFPVVEVLKH